MYGVGLTSNEASPSPCLTAPAMNSPIAGWLAFTSDEHRTSSIRPGAAAGYPHRD
jgi:hypothetical protein